jgi:hypothetical protein
MAKRGKRRFDTLPILHPDAAGIDVGASELYAAVSADRDPEPVRSFPTFTRDFHALAHWLEQCGIDSVAGLPAELDDGNILAEQTVSVGGQLVDLSRTEFRIPGVSHSPSPNRHFQA